MTVLAGLLRLLARFPQYGAGANLVGLSLADLWGLLRFLGRVAGDSAQ